MKKVTLDDKEGVKFLRSAADQGHGAAQYRLALMYMTGRGLGQSNLECLRWMERSAEHGETRAQEFLAKARTEGWFGPVELPGGGIPPSLS